MNAALWVLSSLAVLWSPAGFAFGLQRRLNVTVERRPDVPLVVASLGPGFLMAGMATALVYLVFRLAEPYLGIQPIVPARFALPVGFLSLSVWTLVWSFLSLILRLVYGRHLGRNLAEDHGNEEVLPLWRRWGGATSLAVPDRSYLEWAVWPVLAAAPLLGWAWFSLGGSFRIRPSELAVASVLWTSWALHLVLRGRVRLPVPVEEEEPVPETRANAWPEVLAHLQAEPEPHETRAAEPLLFSEADPRTSGILSPLVAELLPPPGKLTLMQRSVLTKLALQGFVHVDPPVALDQLALSEGVSEVLEDRSGQRVRHQVVLASEGQGKTSLILLAAANHALVHTRGTLVVVRSEEAAAALAERFRRTLEPSLLRWNLRVRHPGAGLMNDLSQGILPDVVICGLRDLVVTVLDQPDTFAPFLRNVGLIVVDDVESFLGPVEVHAQLAFRRLGLRMSDLGAPQFLVLGCDSMEETGQWAKTLCGIDAVVRSFSRPAREAREQEAAEQAAVGVEVSEKVHTGDGLPRHRLYSLRDLGALSLEDLVAACERLAVPWHYRLCGDGRRDLGRGPLPLREEPSHHVAAPEDACVVFLDGTWSEVRREWKRLVRAGIRFSRFRGPGGEPLRHGEEETIAFVTRTDPDVEAAFASLDAACRESLPRPVLRPPTGLAVEPHLSADLVRHWTEVEDVLRVFSPAVAPLLARLAEERLLLCEPRTDVDDLASEYVERVYVRALARAVPSFLPPKVGQVEAASRDVIQIRDRTHLTVLALADRSSAHFLYYPGRIFKDARGTFVVVGREGDILAEPLLADDISSPRRRCQIRTLPASEDGFLPPHRVLLGQHPFQLALEPVEVRVEHVATYRLGPVDREVRQRTLTDPAARERSLGLALETVALVLTPNTEEEPRLTLAGARLFAAILRALLPVIYRGAGESLQVGVYEDRLYLFDAEPGGNGTTRAIYRDGIEPLLRLVRVMAERVTSLERLRALFDEWGDEDEIIAESRGEVSEENGEAARQNLMAWLDSRLA